MEEMKVASDAAKPLAWATELMLLASSHHSALISSLIRYLFNVMHVRYLHVRVGLGPSEYFLQFLSFYLANFNISRMFSFVILTSIYHMQVIKLILVSFFCHLIFKLKLNDTCKALSA